MSKIIQLDKNNLLQYRNTPWDEIIIGHPANEITHILYDDLQNLDRLINQFEIENKKEKVYFTSFRVNSTDYLLKKILTQHNYYYVESSYIVCKPLWFIEKLKNKLPAMSLTIKDEKLSEVNSDLIKEIKEIAKSQFNFGRIAEDFNFDRSASQTRNENWIVSMINTNVRISMLQKSNKTVGFLIYEIKKDNAVLVLGGVSDKYRMLAYNFWFDTLQNIKKQGVNNIETVISAANIDVVNLYVFFEFTFKKLLNGYHKIRY